MAGLSSAHYALTPMSRMPDTSGLGGQRLEHPDRFGRSIDAGCSLCAQCRPELASGPLSGRSPGVDVGLRQQHRTAGPSDRRTSQDRPVPVNGSSSRGTAPDMHDQTFCSGSPANQRGRIVVQARIPQMSHRWVRTRRGRGDRLRPPNEGDHDGTQQDRCWLHDEFSRWQPRSWAARPTRKQIRRFPRTMRSSWSDPVCAR